MFGRTTRRRQAAGLAAAVIALAAAPIQAEEGAPPAFEVVKADAPIRVDAMLDEAVWERALRVDLAYEIQPGENTPAPVRTECRIAYDDENLYFAFIAGDPNPAEIRARVTDRDGNDGDDQVGLMIDPFNDERRSFEFFVNPLGVQTDLVMNDVGSDDPEDGTWDAIWNSAGRITDEGYIVEASIPFTSLRFPRDAGAQTWGFLAFRNYPRSLRHQIASIRYDRNKNCQICQYAKLRGFEGITPGRSFELDPTLTGSSHDIREDPGSRLTNEDRKADLGLSLRWAATPNVSVNGAVNPDFSQVEADAAQLNVNARFALFYDEKRPFFLEGADLFQTPVRAVYTRTVADPVWGAKITGKSARHAGGLFVTRDDRTNLYFPSNQGTDYLSLGSQITSSVLRYRRDVGSTSTLGLLATDREGGGYANRLYGLDGLFRITRTESVVFQALESSTKYPAAVAEEMEQPGGTFGGFAGTIEYEHGSRDWEWNLGYADLGKRFRADAGYVPRVDYRETYGKLSHNWYGKPGGFLTDAEVGVRASSIDDHADTPTDRLIQVYGEFTGPLQSYFEPRYERKMERFAGRNFEEDLVETHFGARVNGRLNTWAVVAYGDAIDYDNVRRVNRWWGGPGFSYDFGRHVQLFLDHTFERLDTGAERVYTANLLQSRLVYQYNVRTFVRVIMQYTDVDLNRGAYAGPVPSGQRTLFTQLLTSYKINPQTVFYLGYSDQREAEHAPDIRVSERTFFAKIGYAWLI